MSVTRSFQHEAERALATALQGRRAVHRGIAVGLLVTLAAFPACVQEHAHVEPPTVAFLTPTEGESVAQGPVAISLLVEHFVLVEPPAVAAYWSRFLPWSEAHAHEEGTPEGFVRLSVDGVEEARVAVPQATLTLTGAGAHTISAELLDADAVSLDPPVTASITIEAS